MTLSTMFYKALYTIEDWLYGGVDKTLLANGGEVCARYLSTQRIVLEVVGVTVCVLLMMKVAYSRLAPLPKISSGAYKLKHEPIRQVLLVAMCIVFGMEIGFKFASRSVIFLLNPCHVVTALQIYLLAAKPSKHVAAMFRAHLNVINGPILACIFPEVDTLVLPLETFVFWAQHLLMIIIPTCMIWMNGAYSAERPSNITWFVFSYGLVLLYHFVFLQGLSLLFHMNLNHMLCPAEKDPFIGPNYRLAAILHQAFFTPFVSRMFCIFNLVVRRIRSSESHHADKMN